ncbi:unnamed protein product [Cyprideis torosa]|uniref:Uncharacterized protein n=1 Tax=Cyprideis torosa TaxID=163714 RepID=A0A7R8WFD0_9CRUS|nr:unnamed protein product [Cyprideis torosa]CAG0896822.1 unnamed protein product [Cyprideis torosa]
MAAITFICSHPFPPASRSGHTDTTVSILWYVVNKQLIFLLRLKLHQPPSLCERRTVGLGIIPSTSLHSEEVATSGKLEEPIRALEDHGWGLRGVGFNFANERQFGVALHIHPLNWGNCSTRDVQNDRVIPKDAVSDQEPGSVDQFFLVLELSQTTLWVKPAAEQLSVLPRLSNGTIRQEIAVPTHDSGERAHLFLRCSSTFIQPANMKLLFLTIVLLHAVLGDHHSSGSGSGSSGSGGGSSGSGSGHGSGHGYKIEKIPIHTKSYELKKNIKYKPVVTYDKKAIKKTEYKTVKTPIKVPIYKKEYETVVKYQKIPKVKVEYKTEYKTEKVPVHKTEYVPVKKVEYKPVVSYTKVPVHKTHYKEVKVPIKKHHRYHNDVRVSIGKSGSLESGVEFKPDIVRWVEWILEVVRKNVHIKEVSSPAEDFLLNFSIITVDQ